MCWGCKNGIKPFRVGSSDVTLSQWEAPKMFPFKSMFGLSRENTFIPSTGTPFAWGYTYKAPYNYYAVTTGAIFDKKKSNLEHVATQTRNNIRRMKHDVEMLNFYRRERSWWLPNIKAPDKWFLNALM